MNNIIHRFWDKVEIQDNDCWEWQGAKTPGDYGVFSVIDKIVYAHRYSYELFEGNITKGLQVDHLCRNRGCCNPDHLEVVTQQENLRRGNHPNGKKHYNGKKIHCPRNHEYTVENTYNHKGKRFCRECVRDRHRVNKEMIKYK